MGTLEHIESLLYRYQCVVVPEFGAFLTQIKPAYLQKDSNSFHPPSKVLSFNAQLKGNDGLLVSHIAQAEHKSYEEALRQVELESRDWLKDLYRDGKLTLDPLGTFRLNSERKISFQPAEKNNYLTASFGLSSVIAAPVTREVLREEVEALEERIPFSISPETRKTSGLRPFMKYAAVIMLSLTAGLSAYTFYRNQINPSDRIRAAAQQEVSRQIQEATFFGTQPLELPSLTLEVTRVREHQGRHHIITGSFRYMENAEKKIRQLMAQGYNARYFGVNPFGLHQVTCGSFEDPKEALKALRDIKREVTPDAWLLSER